MDFTDVISIVVAIIFTPAVTNRTTHSFQPMIPLQKLTTEHTESTEYKNLL